MRRSLFTEMFQNIISKLTKRRFTPGTIISNYEVFEALRRGIAVPFRKADAEIMANTELATAMGGTPVRDVANESCAARITSAAEPSRMCRSHPAM